ncbi:unnamed protein product [Rangifer tarandus platyrhynchus]|uniref:Uncharacterized protein n=1 Tax=Rangifer tarandus platyrhynchus TaxID=3082113 RepID=A0AC59YSZ1_RANTA
MPLFVWNPPITSEALLGSSSDTPLWGPHQQPLSSHGDPPSPGIPSLGRCRGSFWPLLDFCVTLANPPLSVLTRDFVQSINRWTRFSVWRGWNRVVATSNGESVFQSAPGCHTPVACFSCPLTPTIFV